MASSASASAKFLAACDVAKSASVFKRPPSRGYQWGLGIYIPRPPKECFLEVFCYLKTNQKAYLWVSWYISFSLFFETPSEIFWISSSNTSSAFSILGRPKSWKWSPLATKRPFFGDIRKDEKSTFWKTSLFASSRTAADFWNQEGVQREKSSPEMACFSSFDLIYLCLDMATKPTAVINTCTM